jgi:hypothetical protein
MLKLDIKSYQFIRVLTWLIAFYHDAVDSIDKSSLSDKNKITAKTNLGALFSPFLPPFQANVLLWYSQVMSPTNESYFDLLSDTIIQTSAINLPEESDLNIYKNDLAKIIDEIDSIGLPRWIRDDVKESVDMAILALEVYPFLAHRLIRESHKSILSTLFSTTTPDQKKFLVKVATTINIVLAAFIMPHEASEAATTYYGWAIEAPSDVKQIEGCAQPLALPAPKIRSL